MKNDAALLWTVFVVVIAVTLAIDFRVQRHAGEEPARRTRAAIISGVLWVSVALVFGLVLLLRLGARPAGGYLTAYVLEQSLSLDNLFVFALIFEELGIPAMNQRRVLSWGIFGALALRAVCIGAGIALLARFHWVKFVLGGLVLAGAVRLLLGERRERSAVARACNVCGSWVSRIVPMTPVRRGDRFWIRQQGRLVATPLFVALVLVESADIIFAMDSIPAVLAVTRDPLLVYASNAFAVAGLRSFYTLVARVVERIPHMRVGLAGVLVVVGGKMLSD